MLKQVGRMKAVIDKIRDQRVEHLQFTMPSSLRAAFTALETSTTTHRGQLGGSVHVGITSITNGLRALVETKRVFAVHLLV